MFGVEGAIGAGAARTVVVASANDSITAEILIRILLECGSLRVWIEKQGEGARGKQRGVAWTRSRTRDKEKKKEEMDRPTALVK